MIKKITESILLLTLLISTFNCASANRADATNNAANTAIVETNSDAPVAEAIAAGIGAAEETMPDAVVRDLYKKHQTDGDILDSKSRKLIDKYFDKTLGDYLWKDLTTHKDEVGVLDFDPFFNAQDLDIKNLKIAEPKIEGERATVLVTFQNFDRKENLTYSLKRQNANWKISDIKYTDGSTLVGYFKDYEKNNPTTASTGKKEEGRFEGTYKVGETTCTVKPIKMAFEIKWAKGSGTMIFYFDGEPSMGRYVYTSEPTSRGGTDKFVFDDETLTTGTFVRADGREMPVSKVK
jgi:hypothetical protein